ncbi:MAG: hypothetical protein IPH88_02930 [Bacteroidales bacterium]|nr:hypothetical protein [Bacteroidales bacterium]
MRSILIFTIILLLGSSVCLGQNNRLCKKLFKKELSFESFNHNSEEFLQDYRTLIECKFEPIDFQIFLGPKQDMSFFSVLVLMQNSNFSKTDRKKFTYGDLCLLMEEFKKTNEYLQVREIVESSNILFKKVATMQDWINDSLLLSKMNFEAKTIHTIKELVIQNNIENLIYAELLSVNSEKLFPVKEEFSESNDKKRQELPEGMIYCVNGITAFDNYYKGRLKSNETNKPLLLYFTGHGCTNSREVENKILMKPEIQNIINSNFTLVMLFVDDKTALPEQETYFSEILNRKIKYKGEIAEEMQIKNFNTNAQPLFVILDSEEKEIRRIAFTLNEAGFNEFLTGQEKK